MLCLICGLARRILCLLGGLTGGLLSLAPRLLSGLARSILDTLVLSRLIHGVFELVVGVDHLLDLGFRIALGELLGELLQLGAVALEPALGVTHGVTVELLGTLRGLLLDLLL